MLERLVANGFPAVLAEFRDESGIWAGASGVAELGSSRMVEPHGWFRMGSVAKTFTATVVLQLLGEGRLGLDDTVERWLPGLVPQGDGITLLHLLSHTSGLYNYTDSLTPAGILGDRFKTWHPREIVALATAHDRQFAPGSAWSYSNTGYIVLSMVIEAVTGSPYDEEIARRILRPLDLSHTLMPADAEVLPEPHAHGYLPVDGELVDITRINATQAGAAGGMASTASDTNRFFAALLTGGLLGGSELALMQTTTPMADPAMGSGLALTRVLLPSGVVVWGKNGGFFGYHMISFHTADASRQLTVSMTMTGTSRPSNLELLADVAGVFGDPE
jgi:D-alanyl-D-alanine carboxypeptidase